MKSMKSMLGQSQIRGTSTEFHANPSSPRLHKSDFVYDLPEDAVLSESLFDGMFNDNSKNFVEPIGPFE